MDEEEDEGDVVTELDRYVRNGAFWIAATENTENNWCCPVGPFVRLFDMDLDQEEWFVIMWFSNVSANHRHHNQA